jgi:hypothetical protein
LMKVGDLTFDQLWLLCVDRKVLLRPRGENEMSVVAAESQGFVKRGPHGSLAARMRIEQERQGKKGGRRDRRRKRRERRAQE